MTTASQLREKVQSDVNQRLVIATFTNAIWWIPTPGVCIYMRPVTSDERFGASRKTVMEIGGIASEVVEIRNHQLPYETEFKAEDFNAAIDSAVRTGSILA